MKESDFNLLITILNRRSEERILQKLKILQRLVNKDICKTDVYIVTGTLHDELMQECLPDYSLTKYGRKIEDLIDKINMANRESLAGNENCDNKVKEA
ncbi:MAG: hypothetical protein LBE98_03210 [Puniceicoccales bacterium]|nr:hypothetical protein [Puniceicoccales bacterium]